MSNTVSTTSSRSKNNAAKDLALITMFTALICVLGFVSIPVGATGVPIVLQNVATILAGLVLGGRRGFLATGLFLLISLAFPVLAGGRTLIQAFAGPSVGYLLGYLLGATAAGYIAYRAPRDNKTIMAALFVVGGIVAVLLQYLFGAFGLMWRADMNLGTAVAAQGAFILPDLAKLAVMVAIALAVHAAFPQLRRR